MSVTSLESLCIPCLPPSLCLHDWTRSEGDRRLDDMLSNRMKSDERQKHCRVPPKRREKKRKEMQPPLVPGSIASHSSGLAQHMMPHTSHLHLNGLLCTEDSEMSFSVPPPLFCDRNAELPHFVIRRHYNQLLSKINALTDVLHQLTPMCFKCNATEGLTFEET